MDPRRLLLLSSSKMHDSDWLHWCYPYITEFLGSVKKVLFIPFAVLDGWDECVERVQKVFENYEIIGLHKSTSMSKAVKEAEAIMICGGNSFHLLHHLQRLGLVEEIRFKVLNESTPYIGWSAGANVACPNIKTTNDMPIIWPNSELAINIFPYNLNPHYTEASIPNFNGETRDERLLEFYKLNLRPIIGLPEGTGIIVEGKQLTYIRGEDPSLQIKLWLPRKEKESRDPKVEYVPLIDSRSEPIPLDAYIY